MTLRHTLYMKALHSYPLERKKRVRALEAMSRAPGEWMKPASRWVINWKYLFDAVCEHGVLIDFTGTLRAVFGQITGHTQRSRDSGLPIMEKRGRCQHPSLSFVVSESP
jgi:hypothetical protein